MSQFRQQFTQFCIMIRDAVPGLIKSEQIKKYDERIMYNLQMISMILHVPDRKPDINNLFVLQWFELQFIKYMSYVEERCKNLRWNIRLSSKYERDIYKQELLAVCEDYKKKDKYFNGLMDQFERGEVEYKGVKIYPKKDEVKQLSDFKSRIRIWSVKLESIRTKYCEDHEEENEEKKE